MEKIMKQIIIAVAMILSLGVSFVHAGDIVDFDGKKSTGVAIVVAVPAF